MRTVSECEAHVAMPETSWAPYKRIIGHGFVTGSILALAMGSCLIYHQISPGTFGLWVKYQLAKSLNAAGFQHYLLTWPSGSGHITVSTEAVALVQSLQAWSRGVLNDVHAVILFTFANAVLASVIGAIAAALCSQAQQGAPPCPASRPVKGQRHRSVRPHVPSDERDDQSESLLAQQNQHHGAPLVNQSGGAVPVSIDDASAIGQSQPREEPAERRRTDLGRLSALPKLGDYYERYWELQALPFENSPDPKYYFPSPNHEEALHRLLYGIQTRKGAVMLTGDIGCGKTLLSRTVIQHLVTQDYDTAVIADPSFGSTQLLREVLYQLGIDATGNTVDLRHRLNDRLLENLKRGQDTVLIIDEAQAIRDDDMFERLRLLLNFQLNERFLLTLLLLGQPELKNRVRTIPQFYQRIAIQYHLGPFSATDVADYIQFRLKVAGSSRRIFRPDTYPLIYRLSGGVPRKINTLCDLCLLVGRLDHAKTVDRAIVERVAVKVTHGAGLHHRMSESRPVPVET